MLGFMSQCPDAAPVYFVGTVLLDLLRGNEDALYRGDLALACSITHAVTTMSDNPKHKKNNDGTLVLEGDWLLTASYLLRFTLGHKSQEQRLCSLGIQLLGAFLRRYDETHQSLKVGGRSGIGSRFLYGAARETRNTSVGTYSLVPFRPFRLSVRLSGCHVTSPTLNLTISFFAFMHCFHAPGPLSSLPRQSKSRATSASSPWA